MQCFAIFLRLIVITSNLGESVKACIRPKSSSASLIRTKFSFDTGYEMTTCKLPIVTKLRVSEMMFRILYGIDSSIDIHSMNCQSFSTCAVRRIFFTNTFAIVDLPAFMLPFIRMIISTEKLFLAPF